MWIDNHITQPQDPGEYKVLVQFDEMGSLQQFDDDYFDGKEWSHTRSNRQFIKYWFATHQQYTSISQIYENKLIQFERSQRIDPTFKRWETSLHELDVYPIGTLAKASAGGYWYKNKRGWKWNGPDGSGSTFPRPGGDWTNEICLPLWEVIFLQFHSQVTAPLNHHNAMDVHFDGLNRFMFVKTEGKWLCTSSYKHNGKELIIKEM